MRLSGSNISQHVGIYFFGSDLERFRKPFKRFVQRHYRQGWSFIPSEVAVYAKRPSGLTADPFAVPTVAVRYKRRRHRPTQRNRRAILDAFDRAVEQLNGQVKEEAEAPPEA